VAMASGTLTVSIVAPAIPGSVAEMVALPAYIPVAKPLSLMAATPGSEEVQIARPVMS